MKKELLKKKKRFDVVFGIVIASILGLVLNLLANLYYDLFITKTILWSNIDKNQVFGLVFLLLGIWGFLQFFIDDYKNDLNFNISFWKRFLDYFFKDFKPVKIIRIVSGVYLIIVLLAFLLVLFIFIGKLTNFWISSLTFIVIIVSSIIKENIKKNKR